MKQALAQGHIVTAVTRHPQAFLLHHEHLQVMRADVFDLRKMEAAVAGQDAVLSALGVPYSFKPITLYSHGTAHIVQAHEREGRASPGLCEFKCDRSSRDWGRVPLRPHPPTDYYRYSWTNDVCRYEADGNAREDQPSWLDDYPVQRSL